MSSRPSRTQSLALLGLTLGSVTLLQLLHRVERRVHALETGARPAPSTFEPYDALAPAARPALVPEGRTGSAASDGVAAASSR
jgi:hypothetical protein